MNYCLKFKYIIELLGLFNSVRKMCLTVHKRLNTVEKTFTTFEFAWSLCLCKFYPNLKHFS